MQFLFFAGLILLINLFVFRPFFNLDFWGDDWLIFWINKYFHGPPSTGEWNYLNHFFTLYGSQALLMEALKYLFGMNSFFFYLASFIFRLAAAYSIYPLVNYLTKSKLAGFSASLILSIIFTGLETSEYLPHMTSYIALTFLNIFLYFFILSREKTNLKLFLISTIFFFLSFVSAPIRMVGIVPLVILLEIINLTRHEQSSKKVFLRLVIIVAIFFLVNTFGHPFLPLSEPQNQPKEVVPFTQLFQGVNSLLSQVESGKYLGLFSPFISYGNAFIPDLSLPNLSAHTTFAISFSLFVIFCFVLKSSISDLGTKSRNYLIIQGLWWTIFIALLYYINLNKDLTTKYIFPLLLSGYVFTVGILLMIKLNSKKLIFDGLFISLMWPFLSFAVAWLYSPTGFIPSSQRYLIGATISVPIFIVILITIAKTKRYLVMLFLIVFSIHLIFTQRYWLDIEKHRNRDLGNKIWSSIPYYPQVGKNKDPDIFYFQGDGSNGSTIGDLITFGFPPHIDIVYNLNYLKGDKIPIPMTEWKDVVEAVKTGKSLGAYSYPLTPVPVDQIYAFYLSSDNNLINITQEVRQKLQNEI